MQTYTHYKDSGIDWIGQIPAHWDLIKLKHIFREKPKTLNPTLSAGSISFGKVIYKNDEKIPESTKASYQEVLVGDFLINPLNLNYDLISLRIALSTINVVVSSGYIVLQDIIEINKDFYKWFLHQYDVSYMKLLGSGVRQTINFNHIANSLLAFPPIQEQEAIANFLDDKTAKIDALVQTKEQQIEKLKELRQAKIHQAVTKGLDAHAPTKNSGVAWIGEIPEHWEVKRLKNLVKNLNNRRVPLETTIRGNMTNREYDYYGATGVIDKVENYLFEEETILIAEDGANLLMRNLQLIYKPKGKYWVNNHSHILKPLFNQSLDFLAYAMENFDYTIYISGAAQPKLTKENLMNILLIVPQIQEQEQIVAYLDEVIGKIDLAIAQKQEQITKLKEYKQSLINDLVTGKVKVY